MPALLPRKKVYVLFLLPLVDEADYLGDFGVGHDGGDGEGEFLGVDLFGDWE